MADDQPVELFTPRRPSDLSIAPLRLTPTMVSGKLLTLKFIRGYIAEWGMSPSLGEIAAATGTVRRRALDRVRALEREGLIIRKGGVRGISLPNLGATNSTLTLVPELDHVPRLATVGAAKGETGGVNNGSKSIDRG